MVPYSHKEQRMEAALEHTDVQAPDTPEPAAQEVSKDDLDKTLRYHVWSAMAVGLVPLPIVDFVGITGIQLNLLRVLAKKYHIPFFKDSARSVLSSLVGGGVPVLATPPLVASAAKLIPGIGTTAGVVTMPAIAGASTYALGKVFIQHFASGGTFLTFDPEKVKAYYADMFTEGQQVAEDIKQEKTASKTASKTAAKTTAATTKDK